MFVTATANVLRAACGATVATTLLACSVVSTPGQIAVNSPSGLQASSNTVVATPGATEEPSAAPTPNQTPSPIPESTLDPAVVAILNDANEQLQLGPLPSGHEASISEDQARQLAFTLLNVPGPALYVAHGTDLRAMSEPAVWLVIVKAPPMEPFPVGPGCPPDSPSDCTRTWAVNDYGGALISDQTGEMDRTFSTMREVPAPSSTP